MTSVSLSCLAYAAALFSSALFVANTVNADSAKQSGDQTVHSSRLPASKGALPPTQVAKPSVGSPVNPALNPPSEIRFTDVTEDAGLSFVHDNAIDHQSGPMTGGGAVGDFNDDGFADLYVIGGGDRRDALYINNGDGTFSDQADSWNLAEPHRGTGATASDYDNDGDVDLFVTSFGAMSENADLGKHRLYRNDGDRFTNVAVEAGVSTTSTTHPDGYGAAFGDYDRDGDLDLFVGAWHNAPVLGARLFDNQGDGTFVDATASAGIITRSTRAFGAIFADMDNDFFPELLVAGDFGTNRYYRNNQDGTFTELDPGSGLANANDEVSWSIGNAHNAMGTTVGDFNRDGRLDWFVTAIWPTAAFESDFWGNGLYLNQGMHTFAEEAERYRVHDGGWGWGTEAADFDNDGWTDLVMTNGWPFQDSVTGASFDNEASYLWRNNGDGTFAAPDAQTGFDHTGQGRALLTLDYDRDGDIDIVILSNQEPMRLFRNEQNNSYTSLTARWLQVEIDASLHPRRAPHGIGARLTLEAGGVAQTQYIKAGGTYLGQSEAVAHFGLGDVKRIDKLTIDWGDGEPIVLQRVRLDRRLKVKTYVKR
ncbi:MAG: CRTAC1 family protein [Pseudomonadota bacterium]